MEMKHESSVVLLMVEIESPSVPISDPPELVSVVVESPSARML